MDSPHNLDIIIVGAGLSGICALIRARQKLPRATVAVFEKGESVGGTWAKNTYPGLSCDIPSQLYSYSFAPNPVWSNIFASQPEILAYIKSVASQFECSSHVHLKQTCTGAGWLDDELLWRVHFVDESSGQTYVRYSRFLITASGFCDEPNGTEGIHGVEGFGGHIFHSARWNHSFDFRDKDVVVVGNGCSANQFIPQLVKHASIRSLTQVMRSAHWIAPKEDGPVGPWQKWLFRTLPLSNRLWRLWLAAKLDLGFAAFKTDSLGKMLRNSLQKTLGDYMRRTAPSQYHDLLVPDFDFGAKRIVLDHGYLDILHDHRVKLLQSSSLAVVGPQELRAGDGTTFHADVIILASGFKTQELLFPMTIAGRGGAELPEIWRQEGNFASAYMGVCFPEFPNLFFLTGPNTLPSGHSTLAGIESSVEYILRVLGPILSKEAGPLVSKRVKVQVRPNAHRSFNDWIQKRMQSLVYTSDVRNWYIDGRSGRNTLIWPGSQLGFWWSRVVRGVRWGDYEVERRE